MMAIKIIVVHNTLQRHRLYGFPLASISPENLHYFYCRVPPAAAKAGGLVDLGKRAGENATHIKINLPHRNESGAYIRRITDTWYQVHCRQWETQICPDIFKIDSSLPFS